MNNNSILVSKQYPELFHYTDVSAFKSIYKTNQLWATHYKDLNDSSELSRFGLKVFEFIRPKIWQIFDNKINISPEIATDIKRFGGIDSVVDEETVGLIYKVNHHTFGKHMYKNTFITSFCAHEKQSYDAKNGLLSQWRGYGADGGVAIVMDTLALEERMKSEGVFFQLMYMGDVVYDDNDTRIKKDYNNVFTIFPKILDILYSVKTPCNSNDLEPHFYGMHEHYVIGSTIVKHYAFHEEKEVRIVASPKSKDTYSYDPNESIQLKEIRYKQKGVCEARYIELFGNASLPIKRIIIGPSRVQNLNHQKIMDIVKASGIEVTKSEIPFLG